MAKEVDPEAVFSRMFGSSNRLENRIMAGKRAANRSSILDFVLNEAKQLNQKLGTSDRRKLEEYLYACLLYTSPSPRDRQKSRMPSSA